MDNDNNDRIEPDNDALDAALAPPPELSEEYVNMVKDYIGVPWKMQPYTVCYQYEDDRSIGYCHVMARSIAEAIVRAVLFQDEDDELDFTREDRTRRNPMFCFPGHHADLLQIDYPVLGTDIADIEQALES